jgi:TolB-like protein
LFSKDAVVTKVDGGEQLGRKSHPDAERQGVVRFGRFVLDEIRCELRVDGACIEMQPLPFRLLAYLVRHHDRVVSREELFRSLWPGIAVSDAALSSALNAVRRVLGDDGKHQTMLKTLRGRGVRFVAPIESSGSKAEDHTAGPPHRPTVAILPLNSMTSDPRHAYVARGLHEELTTRLTQTATVLVKACLLTPPFDGQETPPTARQLGARYLVEGSVRSSNDLVRLTLRLIDGESGFTVWASSLDEPVGDLIETQSRLAQRATEGITDVLRRENRR